MRQRSDSDTTETLRAAARARIGLNETETKLFCMGRRRRIGLGIPCMAGLKKLLLPMPRVQQPATNNSGRTYTRKHLSLEHRI